MQSKHPVILDTNIFVAAGFNKHSSSHKIIKLIMTKQLIHVWNQETKDETAFIINKIPPLSWKTFEMLFLKETEFTGITDPDAFRMVEDVDDRKFAALAACSGASLISNDNHLLKWKQLPQIKVYQPAEFLSLINKSHESKC